MTEPEAELQATANLSPVSPSPVHTAAPRVVPALQDTADTIDAMVAAAAKAAVDSPSLDPAIMGGGSSGDADGHVVDDDSLDDAYGDDDATTGPAPQPGSEASDSNDDYAKTFDSPIEPEEGVAQDFHHHVSSSSPLSMPPEEESIDSSLPSDRLTASRRPSDDTVAHDAAPAPPTPQPGALPDAAVASADTSLQQQASSSAAQPEPTAYQESPDASDDIQKLVADLTSQPAESSSDPDPAPSSVAAKAEPLAGPTSLTATSLTASPPPSSSALPPRPPLPPHSASQPYAAQDDAPGPSPSAGAPGAGQPEPSANDAGGAPGTWAEATGGHVAPPAHSPLNATSYASQAASTPSNDEYQRQWDQFMADERQYMSEAKWDRFPEGSRIFIGNLSSDKVSKRDVFDVFHRYGRLAQISLKSAYGFVQYHTVEEGRRAMDNLQGIEIKGRRIHLEVSRAQDKSKKDRGRSQDRGRGREGGRRGDKHQQGRDDYRPGRNHSPRRNDYHPSRDDGLGRDRGFHESGRGGRGRSRSPAYGRGDRDSYRRRSPSPYGRSRREADLDLPRRYGADVPDVQMILQPDVSRDFVAWVEGAFKAKGLKTEVMYLHPRFPKDQVIQRQAAEGVHGVVDLDLRAQSLGRIPVQAFDRSGGGNNVRFDQYVDLDPGTAAEVIVRAKSMAAAGYGQGYALAGGYSNPYGGQHRQAPHGAGYPGPYPPQQQHAPSMAADMASLMGQVDNATLQRLLSSMQGAPQAPGVVPAAAAGYGIGAPASAANPQVDLQAILGSLGGSAPVQQQPQQPQQPQHAPPPQGQYGGAYGAQPGAAPNGGAGAAPGGGDAAAQVQNIMAQLARYRQ